MSCFLDVDCRRCKGIAQRARMRKSGFGQLAPAATLSGLSVLVLVQHGFVGIQQVCAGSCISLHAKASKCLVAIPFYAACRLNSVVNNDTSK